MKHDNICIKNMHEHETMIWQKYIKVTNKGYEVGLRQLQCIV